MVTLCLIFLRRHHAFHSGCTIVRSHQRCTRFQFLCLLTNTCSFLFLVEALLGVRGMSRGFDPHVPNIWCWACAICTSSLEKWPFEPFAHFESGFLFCRYCWVLGILSLSILAVNLLSYLWLAYIFSCSVGCLFILWISFGAQKWKIFMKSNLSFFKPFIACAFGVIT